MLRMCLILIYGIGRFRSARKTLNANPTAAWANNALKGQIVFMAEKYYMITAMQITSA